MDRVMLAAMSVPDSRNTLRPMLALVGGAVAIGFAPLLVRWSEVGLNATAFWRLLFALPLLGLVCRWRGAALLPRSGRTLLVLAGLFFGLDLIFWHPSIALTSVANATLLANLTPVFVVAFGWLIAGRRPAPRFAAGATLALAGAAGLALGSDAGPPGPIGQRLLGNLLGVLTAVAYAGYLLCVERSRQTVSALQVILISTAVAALLTGGAGLVSGERFLPATANGWLVLLGLAVGVHALGQGGIIWALGRLPATLSSVVILLQPVVAAGLGWWWLGEALGPADALFAALVLAGVLFCRDAVLAEPVAPLSGNRPGTPPPF